MEFDYAKFEVIANSNACYWAAEADLIKSYFDHHRTIERDEKWIIHQIYKELIDGFVVSNDILSNQISHDLSIKSLEEMGHQIHILEEEFSHFKMFVEVYEEVLGKKFSMRIDEIKKIGAWDENTELVNLRKSHFQLFPELGFDAQRISEGGYCALFRVGMEIESYCNGDDMIKKVCKLIYEEEFSHMLFGMAQVSISLDDKKNFSQLLDITNQQMRARILMRYKQFSEPVSPEVLKEMVSGEYEYQDFIDIDEVKKIALSAFK